jgi:Mn2+/Fe2+ NRAMP family transporter
MFLGMLEHRLLHMIIASVIGWTVPSWVCFTDSHLHQRSTHDVY